ncbi:MAG: RepB family plasmid replication initiator protein [Lachnospiraceae bacterium]|nr:RepB family plasmid replication initiator protein [Lachnospiraceae bacterium]
MANKEKNINGDSVNMSNYLIRAKKQSNLLESKIEVMAIKKLETDLISVPDRDPNGVEYTYDAVEFKSDELKALMGRKGGSFYSNLRDAASRMMQRYIAIEEPESRQFKFNHYYHDVSYNNGTFRVVFENGMQPYIKEIQANYTNLSLPILWSFKTNGAFQLYTHLRSYMYKIDSKPRMGEKQEDQESIVKEYKLSELRVDLGFVNLEEDDAIRAEAKKARPNWDKIDNLDKTPKYKRWSDFYARVIKPGIKEINEKSDIYIKEPETVKTGKGGKITSIKFYVQYNTKYFENGGEDVDTGVRNVSATDGIEVVEIYNNATPEKLNAVLSLFKDVEIDLKEAEILLNDADGDLDEIRKAYEYVCTIGEVNNFMGYMRKAIKEHYADQAQTEVVYGSQERAEFVQNMRESMQSVDVQEAAWKRLQSKDNYAMFLQYLESQQLTEEVFDIAFDTADKIKMYTKWVREGM